MADKEFHSGPAEPPQAGHEERDVNVIAVTRFAIGLSLVIIVALFSLWGLFSYFKSRVVADLGGQPPLAGVGTSAAKLPPQPRLQATPRLDLQDMRAAEDKVLNEYFWIDQSAGVVHIPIDRAIDVLAQKGLPARTQEPPPMGSRNNPTQSGAGQILQQAGGPLAPQINAAEAQGTNK